MAELLFLDTKPPQPTAHDDTPRVAFVTLGCKVNQSDTQKAIADFRAAGFRIVPPAAPADVYVVNTCSVTHIADRKSRQWLRRGARANPNALVVATGCYAESGKETLENMGEVGLVVGYKDKDDLLSLVLERMRSAECGMRRFNLKPQARLSTQHSALPLGQEVMKPIQTPISSRAPALWSR